MGEPTTEASGRFRVATCKVVFSEPCQRNPRSVAPEPQYFAGWSHTTQTRSAAVSELGCGGRCKS
jgi:hypothetical protein